ncbi:MAG TPA: hypothetical protein VGU45_13500 [Microvirga sp.]|jgi:hypothetical protein|nr:hypothetical protein [Microvirga sp.]
MRDILPNIREFCQDQWSRALEEPAERLLKPGIKAVVLIALLTGAAHAVQERAPRKGTAKAAAHSRPGKVIPPAPPTTGSVRR